MRLLIVTAVPPERDAVLAGLPTSGSLTCDVLVGGVGPAAVAARTATALATRPPYHLVISAGIGGGFAPVADVGAVVVASALVAADLGAQLPPPSTPSADAPDTADPADTADSRLRNPAGGDGFAAVSELGFGVDRHLPPAALARAVAEAVGAVHAPVLTVSTATGTAERAAWWRTRHPDAGAEAMEGFGVAEAAAQHGVPVLEVRALSNAVGPRDRESWRIPAALAALTDAFRRLAPVLDSWDPTESAAERRPSTAE